MQSQSEANIGNFSFGPKMKQNICFVLWLVFFDRLINCSGILPVVSTAPFCCLCFSKALLKRHGVDLLPLISEHAAPTGSEVLFQTPLLLLYIALLD